MAYKVVFSLAAVDDLRRLSSYIAEEASASIAERYVARIIAACERLSNSPHQGRKREDIAPGIRTFGWRRRMTIVFQVVEGQEAVRVIGVFSKGRDSERALKRRAAKA